MFTRSFYPAYFAPRFFADGAHSSLGYRVYRRETPGSSRQLVATIAAGTAELNLDSLAAYSSGDYEVRAVSHCGVEDIEPLRLKRIRIDGNALYLGPVPNAPSALQLTPLAGGYIKATWIYIAGGQNAAPGSFALRWVVDPASIAYDAVAQASIDAVGLRQYQATIGPFPNSILVTVNVQALASGGGGASDGNHREVACLVDSQAPNPAQYISVEAVSSR